MLASDSLLGLVVAVNAFRRAELLDRLDADEDSVPMSDLDFSDLVDTTLSYVRTGVFLICALAFVLWLYRVKRNADRLMPQGHRHHWLWALFGWVVPIVWWWIPKHVVEDVWNTSHPGEYRARRKPLLIVGWWTAFLLASLLAAVVRTRAFTGQDWGVQAAATRAGVWVAALYLIAAALAVPIILRITAFQDERDEAPVYSAR
ncbi:DUF4328 domain-containing protein [Nonomuraea sp. NBC_01738]|uniref:DUF4328 domain-containing protein n=1 Tax=Nonomuraea sp. NBC_01738 TaxID=2976003 RepID=UPI002E0F1FA0|nr:DUF4328 domain-containing protein [Nonomuraea sp. NBC_01738]